LIESVSSKMEFRDVAQLRPPAGNETSVHAPDFAIGIAIAVIRIEHEAITAIFLHVLREEQVNRHDIAGVLLTGERSIQLIHRLPAV
jgi:hypothetical protein